MSFQTRSIRSGPDLTNLCKRKPRQYPFALISTSQSRSSTNARYDIFFAYPQQALRLDHERRLHSDSIEEIKNASGFLDAFEQWWKALSTVRKRGAEELPFTGGWFVFLAYELAAEIEPCLQLPAARGDMPLALAVRCPAAIIVDHHQQQITALAENGYEHLLDEIEQDCDALSEVAQPDLREKAGIAARSIDEADTNPYIEQVNRIKQYIRDGDIFQANLSRPWQVRLDAGHHEDNDDVDIFRQLSVSNPGSFAALVQLDNAAIISSSPERLVRCDGEQVETRPIAGTRPRVSSHMSDTALADELMAHPKEQAEHIMLIDLERNDLGRLCRPGSVCVDELMTLESYQHVHHIVSNVRGTLNKGVTPADIIRAVFPGGTITGCPKIRCMEILAEMEQQARGAYTGSLGYINRDGSMDLNILIRTMVREGDIVSFRAGGGIVADSIALHELEETRAKARGMLNVFQSRGEPCKA